MWILFRIIMTFISIAYRLKGMGLFSSRFDQYGNNLQMKVVNTHNQKTGAGTSKIYLKVNSKVFFRLIKENMWLREFKRAGFDKEIQVGEKEFDDAFYIAAENLGILRKLRSDPRLRESLLKLHSLGFERITADGFGHLKLTNKKSAIANPDQIIPELTYVRDSIDSIERSSFLSEPFVIRVMLLELIAYAISGYAVASYASLVLDGGQTHLALGDVIWKGLGIGCVLIGGWFVLVLALLKGSSRLPLILHDFSIPICFVAITSGFQIFSDLNQSLDQTPASITRATLVGKFTRVTGSRRQRRTTYYLNLKFTKNPFQIPEQLTVSSWTYMGLTQGEGVEFKVRQGYFNSPYIDEINSIPSPKEIVTGGQVEKGDLELWRKIARWSADEDTKTQIDGAVKWTEIKYRSGKLRQREPTVNGKRQGMATYWHENGKIYAVVPWNQDQKQGRYRTYREDGSLEQSLSFRQGKPHGLLTWYNEQGRAFARALYENGEKITDDKNALDSLAYEIEGSSY
jgi:hypothetical protein